MRIRILLAATCLLGFVAILAATGDDAPPAVPINHWPSDLWNATVRQTDEVHVVFDFEFPDLENNTGNYIEPEMVSDKTAAGEPLVPGWRITDVATGTQILMYRQGGLPLDAVFLDVAEFGEVSMSPFGAPGEDKKVVIEVVSVGSEFAADYEVARISWEMADEWGSDVDAFLASARTTIDDLESLEGNAVLDYGDTDADDGLVIGDPEWGQYMGSDVRWVQKREGIQFLIVTAGALSDGTPNSVYYDNFVLTLQKVNVDGYGIPDGTVGAGTDAPSTDFGGDGDFLVGEDPDDKTGGVTEVTVIEPIDSKSLAGLLEAIEDLGLADGLENSLLSKLDGVEEKLEDGKLNSALGKMTAFTKEVSAQSGKGIDKLDAAYLISYAEDLMEEYMEDA